MNLMEKKKMTAVRAARLNVRFSTCSKLTFLTWMMVE